MVLEDSPYVRDLLAQPKALEDTLAGLAVSPALAGLARPFERLVLTGMGGSFHALHPLALKLIACGRAPLMAETSELVHHMRPLLDERTLVVAVSQSGRSAEVVRLLSGCAARLLAVTNTPESPLAKAADAVVLTRAGAEFSVSCKTYVATLAALEWLGGVLCGDPRPAARNVAPAMRAYLEHWREHVDYFEHLLDGVHHLFLAGRGTSLAAAGTGGLIVKEAAHFPAEGMSSASFRHGPLEMARGDVFVLVFAGDGPAAALNRKLVADVVAAGGRAALVGSEAPALCVEPHAALEILPVQMISLALARRAGHRPGEFVRASKVTQTE